MQIVRSARNTEEQNIFLLKDSIVKVEKETCRVRPVKVLRHHDYFTVQILL